MKHKRVSGATTSQLGMSCEEPRSIVLTEDWRQWNLRPQTTLMILCILTRDVATKSVVVHWERLWTVNGCLCSLWTLPTILNVNEYLKMPSIYSMAFLGFGMSNKNHTGRTRKTKIYPKTRFFHSHPHPNSPPPPCSDCVLREWLHCSILKTSVSTWPDFVSPHKQVSGNEAFDG